jgi:TnpA family transposase
MVINEYNKFALPKLWGSGKSAAADGTKWDIYEQNLLSEYHIRYGGWGGIGYYHVSDKTLTLSLAYYYWIHINCGRATFKAESTLMPSGYISHHFITLPTFMQW